MEVLLTSRRTQIAEQLRQRLFSGIHLRVLAPGQRLPSVRELAREFNADPRVVMAAYRDLEAEGLVTVRSRAGIFVAAGGAVQGQLQRRTADWMVNLLLEGWGRGISAREFPERVRQSLETLPLRVACIECNHDQLASLAAELRDDYGIDARGVDTFTLLASDETPEFVRRADLLITTPFHIIEVEPVATALAKPWIVAELRVDSFADVARRLPEGPVYFIVADPRFAEKLVRIYQRSPASENLHPLVVGRDDIEAVPGDVPVYVTRLARERLGSTPLPKQVIPEVRAFSRETSRQILSFVVQANVAALHPGGEDHRLAPQESG